MVNEKLVDSSGGIQNDPLIIIKLYSCPASPSSLTGLPVTWLTENVKCASSDS